jgi:hypothetical protein
MEKVQKLIVTTKEIKSISFKFPDIVSPDAEEIIREDYRSLTKLQDQLQEYRTKVIEMEKAVASAEKAFKEKTHGCTIEFETIEKEYVSRQSSIFIKGQGNDILGTFNN